MDKLVAKIRGAAPLRRRRTTPLLCIFVVPIVLTQGLAAVAQDQPNQDAPAVTFGLRQTTPELALQQNFLQTFQTPQKIEIDPVRSLAFMFPPPGNQGSHQSSCTAWALIYGVFSFLDARDRAVDPSLVENQASPGWIYNQLTFGSCEAVYISQIALQISQVGIASMRDYPYNDADCSFGVVSQAIKTRAKKRSIAFLKSVSDFGNMDLLRNLLFDGKPIVVGIFTDKNFQTLKRGVDTYSSFDTSQKSPLTYHAVVLIGYDDTRQAFLLQNSWGADWANGGRVWISYEALRNMIGEAWIAGAAGTAAAGAPVVQINNVSVDANGTGESAVLSFRVNGGVQRVSNKLVQWELEFRDANNNLIAGNPQFSKFQSPTGSLYASASATPAADKYDLSTYAINVPLAAFRVPGLPKDQAGITRINVMTRVFVNYEGPTEANTYSLQIAGPAS